jgi:UPF0755 protein
VSLDNHTKSPKHRWPAIIGGVFALLLVIAVVGGIVGWSLYLQPSSDDAADSSGTPVQVEIPSGASTNRIAYILSDAGVIRNATLFRLTARRNGVDGQLRPGTYDLSTGMPDDLVIERLLEGPTITYITVTIPEGFVIEQIAARLEKQAGIPQDEFLPLAKEGADEFAEEFSYLSKTYKNSLEGYLFPKTYTFEEGIGAREAIEAMLRQFDRELEEVNVKAAKKRGISLKELVVMASMIERETRVDKERPLVASVIYNRLDRGMLLGIDATIEYVLPGNRLRLKYSDLEIDSPYNTYKNPGLPPGPIANPGLLSLKAAAEPDDTDYIYYVLTGKDGTHTFTTNNADFQRAKRKSKEVFGE